MTIAIVLKVGDGVVLGADSATTLEDTKGAYYNSYFNTEKLANLVKGLPLGVITFGLGGLANRSIGSLTKDLRVRLSDSGNPTWYLDRTNYTLQRAAEMVREFFYAELYQPAFPAAPNSPAMGFFVAGYSAGATSAEVWQVVIQQGGTCGPPERLVAASDTTAARWEGQPEACCRLLRGWSPQILERLKTAGMSQQDAINLLDSVEPVLHPTMPIQDAIDLVDYLIEVTCGFVRFAPGPAIVSKPIDLAAITPHEGFRWVRRKHYYRAELNPPIKP